ncbi:Protein mak11 [Paraconiothyrium brasiliense]|uniref:Protein mak11 n=1 Tax=Paraconiothyrium brasiliense TaxID=300254 RepID=A0ABR3QUE5_9PLEO
MAKRKREIADRTKPAKALKSGKEVAASAAQKAVQIESPARRSKEAAVDDQAGAKSKAATITTAAEPIETTTVQIITGSYERVLHGFTAAIPQALVTGQDDAVEQDQPKISFSDTFLFNAHTSAIRCLALTPPTDESSKVVLATGSTDERINLYTLSTAPPAPSKSKPQLPSLHGTSISENSRNKELGALLHHSSSVTALHFPSRAKLLSSSEDSTITITRTRDWAPLSTIKAPIPKAQGRPSGDTAAPGEVPAGVNDFAVHPSNKLMVSVGKGEKCMRLWNLITGNKAGVLQFSRDILASVGEGRFGSGEGRKVVWDTEGEELAVAFERGVVVFSLDMKAKAKILPTPRTKIHQMRYLPSDTHPGILLVSTEDGRIMFYDTNSTFETAANDEKEDEIPQSNLVAAIGGPAAGFSGRVKDFDILRISDASFLIISGSSDGTVRLWLLRTDELKTPSESEKGTGFTAEQVGRLLGTYTTGTRITCLKSFVMTGTPEAEEDEEEIPVEKDDESSSDESE